jgi:hypothetical protein
VCVCVYGERERESGEWREMKGGAHGAARRASTFAMLVSGVSVCVELCGERAREWTWRGYTGG